MAEYFELGYFGLFLASFLAATILPLSSEAILITMLFAGYDSLLCIAIASTGNWLGGLTSYFLGYLGNWKALKKWFNTKEETILKYKRYSDKYGSWLALLCWMPIIGDVIAIALGFFRVSVFPVATLMLVGKTARYIVLVILHHSFF